MMTLCFWIEAADLAVTFDSIDEADSGESQKRSVDCVERNIGNDLFHPIVNDLSTGVVR